MSELERAKSLLDKHLKIIGDAFDPNKDSCYSKCRTVATETAILEAESVVEFITKCGCGISKSYVEHWVGTLQYLRLMRSPEKPFKYNVFFYDEAYAMGQEGGQKTFIKSFHSQSPFLDGVCWADAGGKRYHQVVSDIGHLEEGYYIEFVSKTRKDEEQN